MLRERARESSRYLAYTDSCLSRWPEVALEDGIADSVNWYLCVCPRYSDERRVPPHERRRLLIARDQVVEANSMRKSVQSMIRKGVSYVAGVYLSCSHALFHSLHCSGGAAI